MGSEAGSSLGLTLGVPRGHDVLVRAMELIELDGGQLLSLRDRRIFNILLHEADRRGLSRGETKHWIELSKLRGPNDNNAQIRETVDRLMATRVRLVGHPAGGHVQLLGWNDMRDATRPIGTFHYRIDPYLAEVLSGSNVFALLDMRVIRAIRCKYAMSLYEAVSLRANRDARSETFPLAYLRDNLLQVPATRLQPFKNLQRCALQPAIREINTLSTLCVSYRVRRVGRHVEAVTLDWRAKTMAELRAAERALNKRAALIDDTLPGLVLDD